MCILIILHLANGKVLALELPKNGNASCTALYPASAKASNEIGVHHSLFDLSNLTDVASVFKILRSLSKVY